MLTIYVKLQHTDRASQEEWGGQMRTNADKSGQKRTFLAKNQKNTKKVGTFILGEVEINRKQILLISSRNISQDLKKQV